MFATIRYTEGLGGAAVYARARDVSGNYLVLATGAWQAMEAIGTKAFLPEVADSSAESRYQAEVALPAIYVDAVLEYVLASSGDVIGEDSIAPAVMPPAPATLAPGLLATLDDLKALLGKSDTADDAALVRILGAVSTWFESQTGRTMVQQTVDETLLLDCNQCNVTPTQAPVISLTSVTLDGVLLTPVTDLISQGYKWTGTVPIRLQAVPVGDGSMCELVYSAGWAAIPADVQQAVLEMAALKWREAPHLGKQSASMGGQSVSYLPSIVPHTVQDVVDSYRVWGV